jgi:hypothetical protein
MGGVGKTRAAIEYPWKHADDYRALLYISADSPEALHRNLAALCGPIVLNIPEQNEKEQALQVEAALVGLHRLQSSQQPAPQGDQPADKEHGHGLVTRTLSGNTNRQHEIRTTAMQNLSPIMISLRGAEGIIRAVKSFQGREVLIGVVLEYHRPRSRSAQF